ncbi:insulinase family protein [Sneathiella sp. P13V-1]|uniref:M16 family metallopeptidase n=1 Tax=Sneathiella sp. P13V-1 TaxID=2697366 RepID=UPI00187B17E1|nr:pitrilysin family protein [Sneathiella sp. P13V-1]MBE7638498.1 insulinase family protein [Sneathiella sp. P13V-1]
MLKRLSAVILLISVSLFLGGNAFAKEGDGVPKLFNPKTTTLKNGLEVVVIEDQRAPVVTHMVWYRIGAADEPPGKSGIAHFLEHLMFKGTKNIPPGRFSEIVAENGGQDNAFTSQDYTAYYQNASKDKLPLLMELESDRMQGLILNDEAVGAELQVVLEERSQRTDNNPRGLFAEQFNAAKYLAHPYGIPVIGWRHELEKLTTQDAIDWYKKYYAPNNAILVVAGDVEAEEVFALARKYYGKAVPQEIPERARLQEPPQIAKRTVVMYDKRVRQPSWQQSYLAPVERSTSIKQVRALEVLNNILSEGPTSRLYSKLVIKDKVAVGVGSYYDSSSFDPSSFVFYGTPANGISVEELEKAVHLIIRDVLENGVSDEEIKTAKTRMLASAIYARDSLSTAANIFGGALAQGTKIENVVNWPSQISDVTKQEVIDAARQVFVEERSVVGKLLPEEK